MGFRIEDNCVGPCPMGCIHCGRSHEHVYYCDRCDAENELLYEADNGDEVCWECYKDQYLRKICDDCDTTKCSNCGSEAEEMFNIEGNEWVCESCLKDMAERVDTE